MYDKAILWFANRVRALADVLLAYALMRDYRRFGINEPYAWHLHKLRNDYCD